MNSSQIKELLNYSKTVSPNRSQLVGEGCIGKAYKIVFQGTPYVLKIQKADEEFYNEIQKHEELFENPDTKPHIPAFVGSFEEDGKGYIVMEYLEGNTLYHLYEHRQLTMVECQFIFKKVEDIIKIFHEQGYVYNDLAPCNVFVVIDKNNSIQDVKLIDFGATKIKGTKNYNNNNNSTAEAFQNTTKLAAMKMRGLPRCIAKGGKKTRKQNH